MYCNVALRRVPIIFVLFFSFTVPAYILFEKKAFCGDLLSPATLKHLKAKYNLLRLTLL